MGMHARNGLVCSPGRARNLPDPGTKPARPGHETCPTWAQICARPAPAIGGGFLHAKNERMGNGGDACDTSTGWRHLHPERGVAPDTLVLSDSMLCHGVVPQMWFRFGRVRSHWAPGARLGHVSVPTRARFVPGWGSTSPRRGPESSRLGAWRALRGLALPASGPPGPRRGTQVKTTCAVTE